MYIQYMYITQASKNTVYRTCQLSTKLEKTDAEQLSSNEPQITLATKILQK